MIVRNVPLISFIAAPRVIGSKEATTIVTRGVIQGANSPLSVSVYRILLDDGLLVKRFRAVELNRPGF
jgi:glutamate dehydrogenase/leucine dehydrogenase